MGVLKTLNINTWAGQDIQACLNGVRFPAEEDKKRERRGRECWGGGGRGTGEPETLSNLGFSSCYHLFKSI